MNEQTTQLSVAEIAAALGTENLILRLVQLQRQVTELEAALAALTVDSPPTLTEAVATNQEIERAIAKTMGAPEAWTNGR